jgi:hypothetical protein
VKVQNIPQYLQTHASSDVVVEFDDGDKYPASALDLQGENEDGEFEIYAAFEHCIGPSRAQQAARDAGSPERFPGSWWTSAKPRQPVAMQYTAGRIRSIFDREAGYFVYERE